VYESLFAKRRFFRRATRVAYGNSVELAALTSSAFRFAEFRQSRASGRGRRGGKEPTQGTPKARFAHFGEPQPRRSSGRREESANNACRPYKIYLPPIRRHFRCAETVNLPSPAESSSAPCTPSLLGSRVFGANRSIKYLLFYAATFGLEAKNRGARFHRGESCRRHDSEPGRLGGPCDGSCPPCSRRLPRKRLHSRKSDKQ